MTPLRNKDSKPLHYQLGWMTGAYIWDRMPYESFQNGEYRVDRHSVKYLSPEEIARYNELHSAWLNNWTGNPNRNEDIDDELFEAYRKYDNELYLKYFPHILSIFVDGIYLNQDDNNHMFMEGLISYLWQTDECMYSLTKENITIITDTHGVEFQFKLGITVEDNFI